MGKDEMRKLSESFLEALKGGHLSGVTHRVIEDKDLDLQIRENYINIYFKGNSLLKLEESKPGKYRVTIDPKFIGRSNIPDLNDEESTKIFLRQVPKLKERMIRFGKSSLEIEYEQLIIRANNHEPRNNSEYFIIDRQYATPTGRFDLTGFYWNRNRRRKGQEVPLCYMEVKFALNTDIKDVHHQIERYYYEIQRNTKYIAEEAEIILRQKLELGLFDQAADRLEAMKTLKISKDIDEYQFILVLVDYNPYSKQLALEKLGELQFPKLVKVFHSGFAMWEINLESIP